MHGKRWFCALTALLLFALSGCGQSAPRPEETNTLTETAAQTTERQAEADMASPDTLAPKETEAAPTEAPAAETPAESADIGPLFRTFVGDRVADGVYTLRSKQSGLALITTFSGDDKSLDSDAAGLLRLKLICKGGKYYMLCGTTKKAVELSAQEFEKQAGATLKSVALRLDNMHLKETGEQIVDGKKYSTEVYDEGDLGTVTYFFDESGLRRSSIKKDGKVTQIDPMEVLDEADPAAFEIPADYTMIDDPSQLFNP